MQLMTFDEVKTRIDQLMEDDIHRGIRGEYHFPCLIYHQTASTLFPRHTYLPNVCHY